MCGCYHSVSVAKSQAPGCTHAASLRLPAVRPRAFSCRVPRRRAPGCTEHCEFRTRHRPQQHGRHRQHRRRAERGRWRIPRASTTGPVLQPGPRALHAWRTRAAAGRVSTCEGPRGSVGSTVHSSVRACVDRTLPRGLYVHHQRARVWVRSRLLRKRLFTDPVERLLRLG